MHTCGNAVKHCGEHRVGKEAMFPKRVTFRSHVGGHTRILHGERVMRKDKSISTLDRLCQDILKASPVQITCSLPLRPDLPPRF